MPAIHGLLAALLAGLSAGVPSIAAEDAPRHLPVYTAASIVNAATNLAGPLAPFGLVTIYGKDLSFVTRAISPADIPNGVLPTSIPGAGVSIILDNVLLPLIYVSPGQVNFLIPTTIRPGRRALRLVRSGVAGPEVTVEIASASPGFFTADGSAPIAVRADGSLVTAGAPARPGEVIVLFATGLGATVPPLDALRLPDRAASISQRAEFSLLLDGRPVPDNLVLYAGVTPGFAGLYQINLQLPDWTPLRPEVQIRIGEGASPAGLRLDTRLAP